MTNPNNPASEREERYRRGRKRRDVIFDIVEYRALTQKEIIDLLNTRPAPDTPEAESRDKRVRRYNEHSKSFDLNLPPEAEDMEGLLEDFADAYFWHRGTRSENPQHERYCEELDATKTKITSLVSGLREDASEWAAMYRDMKKWRDYWLTSNKRVEKKNKQLEKELAEARGKNEWIPVSEGLPEKGGNIKRSLLVDLVIEHEDGDRFVLVALYDFQLHDKCSPGIWRSEDSTFVVDNKRWKAVYWKPRPIPPEPSENPPSHKATERQGGGGE